MSDAKKLEKADGPTAVSPTPSGGSSKVLLLIAIVNGVGMLGLLGFLALQTLRPPPSPAAASAAQGEHGEAGAGEAAQGEHGEGGEKKGAEKDKPAEGKKGGLLSVPAGGMGPLVRIPEFVVHLRNPEVDRYARISFDIEVMGDSDRDELNAALPKVRDAIIVYLSDRTVEDLRGSEGLARAKEAMQTKLRELVPAARIRALYISDFVVQ